MKYYAQLRYDIYNETHVIRKANEFIKPKQVSIEEEYAEYRKNVDIDNWQNKRGPRPWEDDNVEYKKLIERRAEESKKGWVFSGDRS